MSHNFILRNVKNRLLIALIALFVPHLSVATYFANPALPSLQKEGLFLTSSWCSFRAGYMSDYLYGQRFRDEFKPITSQNPSNLAKLSTHAATFTFNIKNAFDLTALLGSSQLQIDQEVYTSSRFSWGAGAKFLIYHSGSVFCGLDLKYFESDQVPRYFVSDGYAYNIRSPFRFNYSEMQAGLGAAYRAKPLFPYMYLTYLYSKIEPVPRRVTVQYPLYDFLIDVPSNSVIGQNRWGIAVGGTILGGEKGSITIESRFFNQNAISASGELRF